MEFTWDKTCAARKYTFLRAHFWSPGTAYLKCTCPNVYFWCLGDVYFLDIFGAFPMHFLSKSVFFLRFWYLCLDKVYFFYALGTSVLCRCIFLRLCGNRTCTFTAGVFSYPQVVHFFCKRIFGRQLWRRNPHVCCMCILAACVFLKSSVLLYVLRWLESLPGLENSSQVMPDCENMRKHDCDKHMTWVLTKS